MKTFEGYINGLETKGIKPVSFQFMQEIARIVIDGKEDMVSEARQDKRVMASSNLIDPLP